MLLVTGSARGRVHVIDPREGERWIDLTDLEQHQQVYRAVTFSRRPTTATKRFDILLLPIPPALSKILGVGVCCFSFYFFSLAQPLIIQQIIDKVIGQNFNTLYFLGVASNWMQCNL